jgi:peptidoglycan/xylan/chitin deacetylase (PgdA/CDA1 family)
MPEMERFGMTGTAFVISDLIGGRYKGSPVMTEQMLLDLLSRGWEIGSHTKTHPTLAELSADRIEEELQLSRTRLESVVGRPVTSLAYPRGEFDGRVVSLAARHYVCARGASAFPPLSMNPLLPGDRMRLRAMDECGTPSTLPLHLYAAYVPSVITRAARDFLLRRHRTVQSGTASHVGLNANIVGKWIRKTLDRREWLILCFHEISEGPKSTSYDVPLAEFRRIVSAIATSGTEVITLRDAFRNAESRQHSVNKVRVSISGSDVAKS